MSVEIVLQENDRLDWALKALRRQMAKAGILREVRRRRFYLKPSAARALKQAEARRRRRRSRSS